MNGPFHIAERVQWERMSVEEVRLLDTESLEIYTLNETGALVWAAVSAGCSFQEIVDRVAAAFDPVPTDVVESGVRTHLAELVAAGFLVPVDEPDGN